MRYAQTGVLLLCGFVMSGVGAIGASATQPANVFDGRPEFKEGSDRAYFVWRDGDRWHVRWTTRGQPHNFAGTVRATGGKLESLKRVDLDEELRIIRPGAPPHVVRGPRGRVRGVAPGRPAVVAEKTADHVDRVDDHLIRWTTRTSADIDGFDFTASGVGSLQFDLKIDGVSRPVDVQIGRGNTHPPANPFTVPQG